MNPESKCHYCSLGTCPGPSVSKTLEILDGKERVCKLNLTKRHSDRGYFATVSVALKACTKYSVILDKDSGTFELPCPSTPGTYVVELPKKVQLWLKGGYSVSENAKWIWMLELVVCGHGRRVKPGDQRIVCLNFGHFSLHSA